MNDSLCSFDLGLIVPLTQSGGGGSGNTLVEVQGPEEVQYLRYEGTTLEMIKSASHSAFLCDCGPMAAKLTLRLTLIYDHCALLTWTQKTGTGRLG